MPPNPLQNVGRVEYCVIVLLNQIQRNAIKFKD